MSEQIPVTIPEDIRKAAGAVHPVLAQAEAIQITNQQEASDASRLLNQIKGAAKDLEDKRFSMTRPLDATKQAIMDFFRGPSDILAKAESIIKSKMAVHLRKLKDEQDRLEREAREKQAAIDKKAREDKAEKDRLAREAEDNKVKSADLAAEGDLSASLAALYESEEQEVASAEPAPLPVRAYVPPPPKVDGVSMRTKWKGRIIDSSKLDRRFLMPSQTAIDEYAALAKENAKAEGIDFYQEDIVSGRIR